MALSAPIELNDDELLAVSGGVAVGIAQAISLDFSNAAGASGLRILENRCATAIPS